MKLIYIYHSGFAIEDDNFNILIDYYKDVKDDNSLLNGYLQDTGKRLYIMSSHAHGDHFNKKILTGGRADIIYILSKDIEPHTAVRTENIYFIEKSGVYEDENIKVKAFGSTDVGVSFYIEAGGKRIFHAGDLNNWHWNEEVPESEAKQYEDDFLRELTEIADYAPQLDLTMFPVDPRLGRDYMRGAAQFISHISTKLFAPMHFGGDYLKAAAFEKYAVSKGCKFAKWGERGDETEV